MVGAVAAGSAGDKAGLRDGDVLLSWQRPANVPANPDKADGRFESVFDWLWVEMEQGPRGTVTFAIERDGRPHSVQMPVGHWGVEVRPRLGQQALSEYTAAKSALRAKDWATGLTIARKVGSSAAAEGDLALAFWVYLQTGEALQEARRWSEAESAYGLAATAAETAKKPVARARVYDSVGRMFVSQGKQEEATKAFQSALDLRTTSPDDTVSLAQSFTNLGSVAYAGRDLDAAEAHYKRAFTLQERVAPDSLDLAASLNNLGNVAWSRGALDEAEGHYRRALALREKLAPNRLEVASSLNNLALVAWSRGDLPAAETLHKRALAIKEELAPESLTVASSLTNLGILARERGDLASAELFHQRAVALYEQLAPDSLDCAAALNNLGLVTHDRGEFTSAQDHYQRALAIREKVGRGSLHVAASLNNLGILAADRGDLSTAEAYHQRALTIKEKQAPDSLDLAHSLNSLAVLASTRGDYDLAQHYETRALAIREKRAPDGLDAAESLDHLGTVALKRGVLNDSVAFHERALAIRSRLGAGSLAEAQSHYALALTHREASRPQLASHHFLRATQVLEAQVGQLGGAQETRSGFRAQFAYFYTDYIDLLVAQQQTADAFQIFERSRARTLLSMLAERDLIFSADVPEEVERERKRIAWDYDAALEELAELLPQKDQAQIEQLLIQVGNLRNRQSQLVDRVRRESPRLASLQYPEPLGLTQTGTALDPGTALLAYSIGKDRSYVFVVTPGGGLRVHSLSVGEGRLREEVERFRSLIQRAGLGAADISPIVERGRQLYDLLIQPAAQTIARADRVLIVPDGPLHVLPFAALVRGTEVTDRRAGPAWQYLVEWKPTHVIVSATVYAELRKARSNRSVREHARTIVAFGNPAYPAPTGPAAAATQDAVMRSMLTRGLRLLPLPATATEVAAIAALYKGTADVYLGNAATEERAKDVAKSARYLHFASHGLLDERFPLNSGLALTIPAEPKPGQDNGILQAWEVFERMRIDADLVVLSACETGLGKEMGGEGLVGLTRAFQYAGARSVLASLWSVADGTTAILMERFYGYLKTGRSKDAALRHAQLDLIRGRTPGSGHAPPRTAHPFYWAGFQLSGEWR
jgi:CHAT domain-containing protein/Tfp pilus assembly protein PilF